MPRKPRVDVSDTIHHTVARGNAGIRIFADNDDRRAFVADLALAAERYAWLIHAYCLMDTHFHLIVETPEPTLGSGMQRLTGRYAYGFNRRHRRYGHLFAGRYSDSVIETEAHAIVTGAYVVLNPVRAGLVSDAADWPWSSYRASAGLVRAPAFLETRLLPGMLHDDIRRARELYQELVREVRDNPTPRSG